MDHATKFQKLVQFRAPESLSDAIDAAASKHLQSKSEYIRRSVFESLKADGVDLSQGRLPRGQDGKVDFQKAYERLVTVGGAPAINQAGSMATSA
jgi:hypothetical protein